LIIFGVFHKICTRDYMLTLIHYPQTQLKILYFYVLKMFMDHLDVDEEIANILVQEGFSSIDEVAYVPENEIREIEEFDDALVNELRNRARDVLMTRAIVNEEKLTDSEPAEDLLNMEGMDEALAYELAGRGIVTMEDLAEQSIDDLIEIEDLDPVRAGKLIMTARIPWFEKDNAVRE